MTYFLMFLTFLVAIFLIVLVLIQRGRGGGLAGALGGMGGQSAFGTKAGDLFTKITIGVAVVWILLCCVTIKLYKVQEAADVTAGTEFGGDALPEPGTGGTSGTPAPFEDGSPTTGTDGPSEPNE
jgi:preprotein translocase subunit SecG